VLKISYMNGLISVHRRTNINRLGDDTIDVYERLVTYEGPPHHSIAETVIVGSLLSQSSDLVDGIVRHVGLAGNNSFEITKLVVYAKVRALCCSGPLFGKHYWRCFGISRKMRLTSCSCCGVMNAKRSQR
jgi:hypothetical protein